MPSVWKWYHFRVISVFFDEFVLLDERLNVGDNIFDLLLAVLWEYLVCRG